MSCILEDATKSISKLQKFEHQTRNRFQTKLCLKLPLGKRMNAFIVKKFENTESDKQANSIQILCIVQHATKSFSNLRKLEHWKKNCFQTYLCLKNCFFVKELQEIFF